MAVIRTLYLLFFIAVYLVVWHPSAAHSYGQGKPRTVLLTRNPGRLGSKSSDGASMAEYTKTLQEVWEAVREHFYDPRLHGVDWDNVRANYTGQLRQVRNDIEFKSLVNRMLNELHASHT